MEPTLECRVLLNVLAILIEGRSADAVELSPGQCRLEHVARIHRALGLTRTHHGVQLVNEKDDAPLFPGQRVKNSLETLLKVTAEFCPSKQRAQIEGEYAFVLESLGDLAIDHSLRQPLDDRGLTHTRLANEYRIILCASLQHLYRAANLFVPADHRIKFASGGTLRQIDGVFFQCLPCLLGFCAVDRVTPPGSLNRATQRRLSHADLFE